MQILGWSEETLKETTVYLKFVPKWLTRHSHDIVQYVSSSDNVKHISISQNQKVSDSFTSYLSLVLRAVGLSGWNIFVVNVL